MLKMIKALIKLLLGNICGVLLAIVLFDRNVTFSQVKFEPFFSGSEWAVIFIFLTSTQLVLFSFVLFFLFLKRGAVIARSIQFFVLGLIFSVWYVLSELYFYSVLTVFDNMFFSLFLYPFLGFLFLSAMLGVIIDKRDKR